MRELQGRGDPVTHIHSHFAHDPTLLGLLAHRLTGLPFSFTAHARDLYQISAPALVGRTREASAIVTCCQANVDYIDRVTGGVGSPVHLIYHGADLGLFQPAPRLEAHAIPLIVSVGRLVEKKGFDDLLRACALLAARGHKFRCEIYGDGPCLGELRALCDRLELTETVDFCGPRTERELARVYQRADVFALASRITVDGDRDGLPNVLVEAMACGLPVVSTSVGGIAELVHHNTNGLLTAASDHEAIAGCLQRLLDDAEGRVRLGAAAARTAANFDTRHAAARLAELFEHRGKAS
jgi:glycosyltransferase involved in cell wall biosynthesis